MINQLIIVMCLTFIIHLISTLSYAVRIVSIRTKKVALTISLFNILVLVSRTANTFQVTISVETCHLFRLKPASRKESISVETCHL